MWNNKKILITLFFAAFTLNIYAATTAQNSCQDVCDKEKLNDCIKKFDSLSTEQKAFCTQMNELCKDCPFK